MRGWRRIAFSLLLGFCGSLALGADAALEAREARLAAQLRCVVCQNQTVAESNAPLAADMRREILSQLEAGRSDPEVIAFFEDRYGAFVHYSPPWQPSTWLLWAGPFLFGVGGVLALVAVLRKRSRRPPEPALTDVQRQQARQLLDEEQVP